MCVEPNRYDFHSLQRYVQEPTSGDELLSKTTGLRTPSVERSQFARDRARVLHSAALRRLAAKTQVETAGEEDFPRTRLTHSLEVAQIGRELGATLGCDPDVVDAAGLAHDLGHPPFGHNGEDALAELAKHCGGFEGNAQTLRVLTRLEPKVLDEHGFSAGLNLTRAVLDAATKYPWSHSERRGKKFGVYPDDMRVFDWLRHRAPRKRLCVEAQVMDWADDVAYSVHDVEDGVQAGHIKLHQLDDRAERVQLCEQVAAAHSSLETEELGEVLEELLAQPALRALAEYDRSHRAQAAMKQATSSLVGLLVRPVTMATLEHFHTPITRYQGNVVIPPRLRAQCALLKGIAVRYVMARPSSQARYNQQQELLIELVWLVAAQAPTSLDAVFAPWWEHSSDDAARFRVVIDQIASLTDRSVLTWHIRLSTS
ncbi:MAG: deoxyguanosinetriphosphate triphosphohydrolase [Acidimicrobiales bacterium]|nr:MAG: deoxyguanosinetriphosphate triphosphohydrolase [Acidimicrobiales bacterium]